jgi:hypothetical protein
MPYRPVRAVGQKVEAPAQSDQNIAGDEAHNLPSTIITLLCAAALVALAVIITMLPFVLL